MKKTIQRIVMTAILLLGVHQASNAYGVFTIYTSQVVDNGYYYELVWNPGYPDNLKTQSFRTEYKEGVTIKSARLFWYSDQYLELELGFDSVADVTETVTTYVYIQTNYGEEYLEIKLIPDL